MPQAITITLVPCSEGSTSTGSPWRFTLTLPEGVDIEGLCRRGGKGTTKRDWVAYGSKTTLPVSASEDFKAFIAWKESQVK
jgi:hypothetical protein